MALLMPADEAAPHRLRYWHIRNTAWDKDSDRTHLVIAGYFSAEDREDRYPQAREQVIIDLPGNLTGSQAYAAIAAMATFQDAVPA